MEAVDGTHPGNAGPKTITGAIARSAIRVAQIDFESRRGKPNEVTLGRVETIPGGTNTWYRVASPSVDLSEQSPGELFIRSGTQSGGADEGRLRCSLIRSSATEAVVEVIGNVSLPVNPVLVLRSDPSMIAKAFLDYLTDLKSAGLARALTRHIPLAGGEPIHVNGLNPDQQRAVGFIVQPGVSMVWGPPGTGKTRVIAEAIAALLQEGRSVCLVSNTNVAVDAALLHVVEALRVFAIGDVVRVGHPSMPGVVEHPHLLLRKILEVTLEEQVSRMRALELLLGRSRIELEAASSTPMVKLLENHDESSLERLRVRQRRLVRLGEATEELAACEDESSQAGAKLETATKAFDKARTNLGRWASHTSLLDVDRQLAANRLGVSELQAKVHQLERQLQQTAELGIMSRRRRRRELEVEVETTRRTLASALDLVGRLQSLLDDAAAGGITPAKIRTAQGEEKRTKKLLESVQAKFREAERRREAVRREVKQLSKEPKLSDDDVAVLDLIDELGSAKAVLESAREPRAKVDEARSRCRSLASQVEQLQREIANAEETVLRGAKFVATTLAQLVLNRSLASRSFDFVIVDEASAALSHTVYAALSKARVGAALVGDFEQNWPIAVRATGNEAEELKAWLERPCFSLVGVDTTSAAMAEPGCAVLSRQYRFGPRVTELANRVAYEDLLVCERSAADFDADEITFIDTSRLPSTNLVEQGPRGTSLWWAAGTAISLAVARTHGYENVGIITPYRAQADLTRSHFLDHGGGATQIGTVHSFQGREFPVAIIDLVEDGSGRSWIAKGRRGGTPFESGGARVFTVGVTRGKERLYIIGSIEAVRRSRHGPLSQLRHMIGSGAVAELDARDFLAPGDAAGEQRPEITSLHGPGFAPNILDHIQFYEFLKSDLSRATQRCLIVSPFAAARRVSDLLPHLELALARGVEVIAVTKELDEVGDPDAVELLRRIGVRHYVRQGLHEKIVLIDDALTYVGSLNTLSNSGRTSEVMFRLEGDETNQRLLGWLREKQRRTS